MPEPHLRHAKVRCPCCGYRTLDESVAYEICILCWWEDDGQDDPRADEVWGGPNGRLSLSDARRNFLDHLTKYDLGNDTRVNGADSAAEIRAKRAIVSAYHELDTHPEHESRIWEEIDKNDAMLLTELLRKLS